MNYPNLYLFLALLFVGTLISCDKNESDPTGDIPGEVKFYLIDAYETVDETPEIDFGTVVLNEDPLLYYSDLKAYNAREFFFKLTDGARDKIENMEHSVGGIAFAVTADEELVYTGYFVPSYSSISMQWVVIDPTFWHFTNRMYVNLGYPGQVEGVEIPDLRNDERILRIFRRDGKLDD
jgi:hypothetical protein